MDRYRTSRSSSARTRESSRYLEGRPCRACRAVPFHAELLAQSRWRDSLSTDGGGGGGGGEKKKKKKKNSLIHVMPRNA